MSNIPYVVHWIALFIMLGFVALANSLGAESLTIVFTYGASIFAWSSSSYAAKGRKIWKHLEQHHPDEWGYLRSHACIELL